MYLLLCVTIQRAGFKLLGDTLGISESVNSGSLWNGNRRSHLVADGGRGQTVYDVAGDAILVVSAQMPGQRSIDRPFYPALHRVGVGAERAFRRAVH